MKEIKFRALYKLTNKYANIDSIDFTNQIVVLKSYPLVRSFGLDKVAFDEVIIEQFTGLKDKNGKDIYEGDIVKVSYKEWRKDWEGKDKWNYWDNIENIVFIYGGFMFHTVVFDTDMYRPMIPMFNNCELNGIEVIGNIHENKGE